MTMTDTEYTQGENLWRDHETYIKRLAADTARSYWKVDAEDVEQEIWVFLWQKEEAFVSQERSAEYVRTCIKNCVYNYALKQRNTTLLETDTFYFGVDEVKALLPTFFSSYEAWASPQELPPGSETMTKNDNVEIYCDFSRVWDRLTEGQQDILSRRYQEGEDFPDATDRKTLSRAVKRFMELLNQNKDQEAKSHNGPGSRKVITNAAGLSEVRNNE